MYRLSINLALLIFLMPLFGPLFADALLEYEASINYVPYSEMGMKREYWLGDVCSRAVDGPAEAIVHHEKQRIYIVNHTNETYIEAKVPFQAKDILPDYFFAGATKRGFTIQVDSQDYHEEERYGWSCSYYDFEILSAMMDATGVLCIADSVPGVDTYKFFELQMIERFAQQFDESALEELSKLKGVLVSSEVDTEILEREVRLDLELVSVRHEHPPKGACVVPAGYEKKKKFEPAGIPSEDDRSP